MERALIERTTIIKQSDIFKDLRGALILVHL
jgi:hypothetical protein